MPAAQTPEQHSVPIVQLPAFAIQQVPLLQVPVEQVPQLPPQPLSPHALFVQSGVQQPPLRHVWPELQSVFVIQPTQVDVLVSQTSPEQQSLVLAQPVAPFAIQGTQ